MSDLKHLSAKTLMDQAISTAYAYMNQAATRIDAEFGAGYAKANPTLLGSFVQAAAVDFAGSLIAQKLMIISDQIEQLDMPLSSVAEE